MSKPVVAEVTKANARYPKGAELGFDSEAKAKSVLGEGNYKITRYQSGDPYEAPKRATTTQDASDDGKKG